jgi:hypothetical protein
MNLLHYLIKNSWLLFWLFTFPIFGQLMSDYMTKVKINLVLVLSFILGLLRILGFRLEYIDITIIILLTFLASLYSIRTLKYNWRKTQVLTIILFFIFGFFYCISKFVGLVRIQKTWIKNNYKIELIEERGFSGGSLYSYKLSKYYFNSIVLKNCHFLYDIENIEECQIIFEEERIKFDKCMNEISILR